MENVSITNGRLLVINVIKAKCPNFRNLVEAGLPLPDLPYSLTIKRSDPVAVSMSTVETSLRGKEVVTTTSQYAWTSFMTDNSTNFQTVNALLASKMDDFARSKSNKLLSKIKSQSLPIIMLYKERKETGQLLTKFADHILYFLKNWKHPTRVLKQLRWDYSSKSTKWMRHLKRRIMACDTFGNAWNQYRFAWLPLVNDISEALKAASEYEKKIHTFSARVGDKFQFEVDKDVGTLGYDVGYIMHGVREGWYGMTVNYGISDTTLSALGSFMDIPTTIWDSVPWSFVIDWAVSISQYLDLQNATIGTSFSSGCTSVFYKQTVTSPGSYRTYYPDVVRYNIGVTPRRIYTITGGPSRSDVSFNRTVMTSFPRPRLEYPLNASFTHLVDTFTLISQRLIRHL